MGAVRKPRTLRSPLPIPPADVAELERLKALVTDWSIGSETAKAYWRYREDVFMRANRCIHCGNPRRGRRLCRDCYRA